MEEGRLDDCPSEIQRAVKVAEQAIIDLAFYDVQDIGDFLFRAKRALRDTNLLKRKVDE